MELIILIILLTVIGCRKLCNEATVASDNSIKEYNGKIKEQCYRDATDEIIKQFKERRWEIIKTGIISDDMREIYGECWEQYLENSNIIKFFPSSYSLSMGYGIGHPWEVAFALWYSKQGLTPFNGDIKLYTFLTETEKQAIDISNIRGIDEIKKRELQMTIERGKKVAKVLLRNMRQAHPNLDIYFTNGREENTICWNFNKYCSYGTPLEF